MKNLDVDTKKIRNQTIDLLYESSASHLGSSLSLIEIVSTIYLLVDLNKIKDHAPDRSRVFISKGHGACGTYSVMNYFGLIDDIELNTYHKNNSYLSGHISHAVSCVEHSTGALGHGISVCLGTAIGIKTKNFQSNPLSLVVCGDGELQEGSVWETLMLAGHLKLNNFIVFIDYNKISSIKSTNEVVNLEPLEDKFLSFGFETKNVDGHNIKEIYDAVTNRAEHKPLAVICNTIKGKGVSFAENEPVWHYRALNKELYIKAKNDLK
jgi:transketolase